MSSHPIPRPPIRTGAGGAPLRDADLEATVAAAAAGHEWAWSALVTAFRPTVLAAARRHRLQAGEQDEVEQETWLRLFRRLDTVRTPAALGGWLAATARNEALRVLQRDRREVVTDVDDLPQKVTMPDLDAALVAAERREALHRAVEAVPARQGALLRMMLRTPEPSYEEISAALRMPVGSIGPSRARGMARLRRDVELGRVVSCP